MVQVVILRHANSLGNKFGFRQGQTMDFPLSEEGIKQAEELPKILSDYDVTKIYSSDLRRASETVQFSGIDEEIPHEETALIREMDFGKFSGITKNYDDESLPYALEEHPRLGERWPDGERYVTFYNRVRAFCQQLVVDYDDDETVAVIMHQGTLMSVLDLANGVAPLEEKYESVSNLSGYVFEMTTDHFGIDGELEVKKKGPVNH